ncbi:Arc family DNA-binding protein [Brucella tritici]|uniref:Arc family DNA-binding protein n=1 Tax=Brucella tritici TaxID=94626 RepID=UPI002001900F|nr:Arc family DNA-binding protein [Brucella tritici]
MINRLPQMRVRVPLDVKAFIESQALENASSLNSEIVRAIRAAMKAKGPETVAAVPSQVPANHANEKATEHEHE